MRLLLYLLKCIWHHNFFKLIYEWSESFLFWYVQCLCKKIQRSNSRQDRIFGFPVFGYFDEHWVNAIDSKLLSQCRKTLTIELKVCRKVGLSSWKKKNYLKWIDFWFWGWLWKWVFLCVGKNDNESFKNIGEDIIQWL